MRVKPGASFVWTPIETGTAGLVGTLAVAIYDGDTAESALTTAGVNEIAASGVYEATLTAPAESGRYVLIASLDGSLDPDQLITDELTVGATSASFDAGAAFASTDELGARLGITLSGDETTRAQTLLSLATGLIQDHVKQTIFEVGADVLTMPGTNADRIHLPERPVISVASVTIDGRALTEGADWWLDGNTIMRRAAIYSAAGLLGSVLDAPFLLGSGFGRPTQALVITYSHGYADAEIPSVCKAVCLEAVVRCFVNPGAVARETVGNTSTVYDNMRFSPSGLLLTTDERRRLNDKFGTRAVAVSIGA